MELIKLVAKKNKMLREPRILPIFLTCLIDAIIHEHSIWTVTCNFQQCGILSNVDSDEPMQPRFKPGNFK